MKIIYHRITVPVKSAIVRPTHGGLPCERQDCNCSEPFHVDLEIEDSDTYSLALDLAALCGTKQQEDAFVAIMQNRFEDAIEILASIKVGGGP